MKQDIFKKGDTVLISSNEKIEVGIISRAYKSKTVQVYDVYTERGSYLTKITTDSQKLLIFIDVDATKKFINKIHSNLTLNIVNDKINNYEITDGDVELPGDDYDRNSTEPV